MQIIDAIPGGGTYGEGRKILDGVCSPCIVYSGAAYRSPF